jgi:uncharacterized membrane protein YeiH
MSQEAGQVTLAVVAYLGTVAFAISGALKGVRRDMDLFGVAVLATVTAIGGGTLRDAMLQQRMFWVEDPNYVLIAVLTAIVVFLAFRVVERTQALVLIFDAVGLGLFTAIGAEKAQAADTGLVGVLVMAVITGVGGGILRDMLAGDVPVVLKEDVYASASLVGGLAFWGLETWGVARPIPLAVAAALTVVIRLLSMAFHWQFPHPRRVPPAPSSPDPGDQEPGGSR